MLAKPIKESGGGKLVTSRTDIHGAMLELVTSVMTQHVAARRTRGTNQWACATVCRHREGWHPKAVWPWLNFITACKQPCMQAVMTANEDPNTSGAKLQWGKTTVHQPYGPDTPSWVQLLYQDTCYQTISDD